MAGIIHSTFYASKGDKGWITTTHETEVIKLPVPMNTLSIDTMENEIALDINGTGEVWYIDAYSKEQITGLKITELVITAPIGSKIRWKGLGY